MDKVLCAIGQGGVLIQCTMTQVAGKKALRTSTAVGVTINMPKKGEAFTLVSESIDKNGHYRIIRTSPVMHIQRSKSTPTVYIQTENSTYKLVFVEEKINKE